MRLTTRAMQVAVATAATTAFVALSPASASAATTYDTGEGYGPYKISFLAATIYSQGYPDKQPQGVNDWGCTPDDPRKQPVVLVHGTYANQYNSFARMAPELDWDGYCVYAFNYGMDGDSLVAQFPGIYGTTGLSANASELEAFTDEVMQRTGASEVDMVGWSQGGTLINDYLKRRGGDTVDDAVTLGATHHGTTLLGLGNLADDVGLDNVRAGLGQAAVDQVRDSEYIAQLNAEGDTVAGVDYTVIATRYDEVSTPYSATFLEAVPGANVDNVTLQNGCWLDKSDHLSMMYSPRAIDITRKALDPDGRGYLRCRLNLPIV